MRRVAVPDATGGRNRHAPWWAAALVALAGALAGCGGGGADRTANAPPALDARTTRPVLDARLVAALGDSITAGSPLWDPDPGFRARISAGRGGEDPRSQWEHWYLGAHPGTQVRNCGVFGERTDEIRARLRACAGNAAALVIQGGINDIAQGRPVADAAADLDAMVRAGKAPGRRVALVEVLPWNNGYPDAAPRIVDLNRRIRLIGAREGVPVLPWFHALEDPARPGRMRADLTIDGDHPSVAGYRRLGRLVDLR